jgi:dihydrodipicolinate synthase/N-acetylneuraminate lyase
MNDIAARRRALQKELFPGGIPRFWCPLLTHYRSDGSIDFDRMSRHLDHIIPWAKGFLIPGSTGDGWELDDDETLKAAQFAIRKARTHKASLLLGVLKGDTGAMERTVSNLLALIEGETGISRKKTADALKAAGVCGFTVCPPGGKRLTQADIEAGLSRILDLGLPTALYQLPQVTENEAAPETFERLVRKYSNLIFFKDSSGRDGIALSGVDKGDVFLVRGAEGEYARWLRDSGGPYDGFLLSTANCFPREIGDIIKNLEKGDGEKAREISDRITRAVNDMFALVHPLPCGNAFTNANKAFDHFFAFGPKAAAAEGPMLHAKARIPAGIIAAAGDVLSRCGLMPGKGYLE